MKNNTKKRIATLGMATMLLASSTTAIAHPGRTDSNGGHRDNQNKSGLGSYHYHCGDNPAHLHKNGVCPYSAKATTKSSKKSSTSTKSADIKKAQQKLNELGYNCGKADGVMGTNTKAAIKKFQKNKGLAVDGVLGPKTKKALGI
ncbi:peptidoglycan-binding protein [Sporanaerobacter acetigenes]|uniref:peptidoglycan-binding protein n=1 Tax=Sporanaerobacter acetigenes TaxID=165813 RepID=UPI00104E1191|nr:peptidoglycan-binding protein [Sporanaerobacter acetigenes]